ncbi:MAG TPA: DUF3305 domain-containing protein [Rhodospirillales bacterium]|jgi:hypothetical protein|nr:DUF3305 domain-containing protein [Rhodospirillales bacterium]
MSTETTPTPGSGSRQSVDVGIVIERRMVDSPWQDYEWSPVAVIVGAPPMDATDEWMELRRGDDWVHFHAGTLPLELFAGETEGYRKNISEDQPYIYIVLNPGEEADDPEVIPFLATACPYEAESYTEDTDQIVEGVPMPPEVVAWVLDYIDTYHVDVKFEKRKQKKAYDPRKGGFQQRPDKGTRQ